MHYIALFLEFTSLAPLVAIFSLLYHFGSYCSLINNQPIREIRNFVDGINDKALYRGFKLKITEFYVDDKLSSRRRWDRAEKKHSDEIFIYFLQICKIFKKLVARRTLRE